MAGHRRRTTLARALTAAVAAVLAFTNVAFAADQLLVDGDNLLTNGATQSLDFGSLCPGAEQVAGTVLFVIERDGGGQVFAGGSVDVKLRTTGAAIEYDSGSPASLSAAQPGSLTLPAGWSSLANGTRSSAYPDGTTTGLITLVPGSTSGSFGATVKYQADQGTVSRNGDVDVSWTVLESTDPACSPGGGNTPPTVGEITGTAAAAEGALETYSVSATDEEDPISYAWSITAGAAYASINGAASGSSVDINFDDGLVPDSGFTLEVVVTAGFDQVTKTKVIAVSNAAPDASNGSFVLNPYTGKASASVSFSDPGWKDSHTASFAWGDGSGNTAGTAGGTNENVRPDATGTFSAVHTYTACASGGASVTVTDKDLASDSETLAAAGIEVYSVSWKAPLKDGARNIVKLGNVIPVKLAILGCDGLPVTGKSLSIRVMAGDVYDETGADDANLMPTESVQAHDTNGVMRFVDGMYMYNQATRSLSTALPYTIVIKDTATNQFVASAVIEAKR